AGGSEVVGVERNGGTGHGRVDGPGLHHDGSFCASAPARSAGPGRARMSRAVTGSAQGGPGGGGSTAWPPPRWISSVGGPGSPGHPVVAPVQQRTDHRIEVASLLGEPVLVAWRPLLVADALQHAGADEPSQPIGKPVAAQADGLEALEATDAEKGVAQDE